MFNLFRSRVAVHEHLRSQVKVIWLTEMKCLMCLDFLSYNNEGNECYITERNTYMFSCISRELSLLLLL